MLSVAGVVHNDLFMRNIVVDNFASESKITNPILIDFGEAITCEKAEWCYTHDLSFFLKTCYCGNPRNGSSNQRLL